MKKFKFITFLFTIILLYNCNSDDVIVDVPETSVEVIIDENDPNLIFEGSLIINYGKQRNSYSSNGVQKWEVRYKFCFNAPVYNNQTPLELRVYSKKTDNIYIELYKGNVSYFYNNPIEAKGYFTSMWEIDTEASIINKEHRIEFLYSDGTILYQNLGTNYTCEGFNELSCFECI